MSLNVAIITSSAWGSAAHHLPVLLQEAKNYRISTVLLNTASTPKNGRWAKRKIKKVLNIRPLGALIGWRMRQWYTSDVTAIVDITSLDETASNSNLELQRLDGLNSRTMQEALEACGADVAISLGNGFIAPRIFSTPRFGMLNVHHEELPRFRNAQSVIWQLHEGRSQTGYTIHEVTRQIDGGRILKQGSYPIHFKDTLRETVSHTYAATWDAAALGLAHVLNAFESHLEDATEQGKGGHFTTPTYRQFRRIQSEWRRLKAQPK